MRKRINFRESNKGGDPKKVKDLDNKESHNNEYLNYRVRSCCFIYETNVPVHVPGRIILPPKQTGKGRKFRGR